MDGNPEPKTGKKIQGKNLYVSFWDFDQNIRRVLLTKLNVVWLQWLYENWYFQVDKPLRPLNREIFPLVDKMLELCHK